MDKECKEMDLEAYLIVRDLEKVNATLRVMIDNLGQVKEGNERTEAEVSITSAMEAIDHTIDVLVVL